MRYQFTTLFPPPPWINKICVSEFWLSSLLKSTKKQPIEIIPFAKWDRKSHVDALLIDQKIIHTLSLSPKVFAQCIHSINVNGFLAIEREKNSPHRFHNWRREALSLSMEIVHDGYMRKPFYKNKNKALVFIKRLRRPKQISVALPLSINKKWQQKARTWIEFFQKYHLTEQCELIFIFDGIAPILPAWSSATMEKFWNQSNALLSIQHYREFGPLQSLQTALLFSQAKYFLWAQDFTIPCYEMFSLLERMLDISPNKKAFIIGKKILSDTQTGAVLNKAKISTFLLLNKACNNKIRELRFMKNTSNVLSYCKKRLFLSRTKKIFIPIVQTNSSVQNTS